MRGPSVVESVAWSSRDSQKTTESSDEGIEESLDVGVACSSRDAQSWYGPTSAEAQRHAGSAGSAKFGVLGLARMIGRGSIRSSSAGKRHAGKRGRPRDIQGAGPNTTSV
jgi:hypothetical protein